MAKKPRKASVGHKKLRMGTEQTITLVNELGDALNTFSLAMVNGIDEEGLRNLIINRTGNSRFMKIKQIGMQLATAPDPVEAVEKLREALRSALHDS
jgi:hypothetical protein